MPRMRKDNPTRPAESPPEPPAPEVNTDDTATAVAEPPSPQDEVALAGQATGASAPRRLRPLFPEGPGEDPTEEDVAADYAYEGEEEDAAQQRTKKDEAKPPPTPRKEKPAPGPEAGADEEPPAEEEAEEADAGFDAEGLPPGFEAHLHQMASQIGITPDYLRSFGSPRQQALVLRGIVDARRGAPQPQPPPQPPAAPPTPQPPQQPSGPFKLELAEKLDAEEYGEELSKLHAGVRGMHDHYRGQVTALQQQLAQMTKTVNEFLEGQLAEQFDRAVTRLGDEFAELLGTESSMELDPSSAAYKNRWDKVFPEFKFLASAHMAARQPGQPVPSLPRLVKQAVRNQFQDQLETSARKKIASQLTTRSKAQAARAGRRETPSPALTGEARALQRISTFLDEQGVNPITGEPGEENF